MPQKVWDQSWEDGNQDDDVLARAALKNPDAFAIIYRRYVDRIYRYVAMHMDNEKNAEDLTAEVFLAALNGLPKYRKKGLFSAWLFAIARNKLTDSYRKQQPRLVYGSENFENSVIDVDALPLAKVIQAESLEHLVGLIQQLKPQQIELLQLRFSGKLTYAEIASVVGRSEAAVKMSIRRILRRLQDRWEVEHE